MGRRWGKTVLGGALVGLTLQQHGRVAWIAPTYKNTRPMWRWLLMSLMQDAKQKRVTIHKAERTIETRQGGFLGIYSGDNIDSIRGESFHLVVLDEAARLPEDAWTDAIMPTLADMDGDAVLISTPKGKNWFFQEWQRGRDGNGDQRSWTAPTNANPMPTIRRAFERVRERVPERTFRQEWMAEFVEGGSVFRRVMDAATAVPLDAALDGHSYAFGIDWGRTGDATVITVLDLGTREVVALDRFNQTDYALQLGRLRGLADRFQPTVIIAEANSMGGPLVEALQQMDLPVQPFVTSNATKAVAVDALALAFERGEIKIPNDAGLIGELQAFEATTLPSGLQRYAAPEGMHDDMVISLCLAWQAVSDSKPLLLWG